MPSIMSLVSTGNVSKRSLTRCLCHNLKSPNTVPKPTRYYLFDGNAILWTFCASANSTLITCMHKNRLVMNVCHNCHNNWQNNYAENDFKWWGHFWKLYLILKNTENTIRLSGNVHCLSVFVRLDLSAE